MKGLGGGIINIIFLPFRAFKLLFSYVIIPFKFISEQIEFEKRHETQRKKHFSQKRRSRKFNNEIN
jgi:hypothetical protein